MQLVAPRFCKLRENALAHRIVSDKASDILASKMILNLNEPSNLPIHLGSSRKNLLAFGGKCPLHWHVEYGGCQQ
jgi:hypothetical protein